MKIELLMKVAKSILDIERDERYVNLIDCTGASYEELRDLRDDLCNCLGLDDEGVYRVASRYEGEPDFQYGPPETFEEASDRLKAVREKGCWESHMQKRTSAELTLCANWEVTGE